MNRTRTDTITRILALVAAFVASGCGYVLQNSHSELMDKEGIRSIYVKPLVNNTFKPGIENIVYNALVRTLLAHGRVKLARSEENADAVLQGYVNVAQFAAAASAPASSLSPGLGDKILGSNLVLTGIPVATIYVASLACDFKLNRRVVPPGKRKLVWNASFSRPPKPFSAANQLDVPGTTSALINESEFERALAEMATGMMDDVHESMLAMF